jgi:hypothetical protein
MKRKSRTVRLLVNFIVQNLDYFFCPFLKRLYLCNRECKTSVLMANKERADKWLDIVTEDLSVAIAKLLV